ncbi:MAG: helicase-related protein [Campylobacterota bacterium]|nr:helicase-related protein [Campylobacterota bacterium]
MKTNLSIKTQRKKLNQEILKYFDGSPYTDGIGRVDTQTLLKLLKSTGFNDEIDEKKVIKVARQFWSSGSVAKRQAIVDFFAAREFVYIDDEKIDDSYQTELKLNSLFDELEMLADERDELFPMYKNKKTSNITLGKLQHQLSVLRRERLINLVKDGCDVDSYSDNRFEFRSTIEYDIFNQKIHKEDTLKTKRYKLLNLKSEDIQSIVKEILLEKENLKTEQQKFVDKFVANLETPHRYLNYKEIIDSLQLTNVKDIKYPKIREKYLAPIVTNGIVFKKFQIFKTKLRFQVETSVVLPRLEKLFEYLLHIDIDMNYLLNEIWKERDLEIWELVIYTKEQIEFGFFEVFERILKKCRAFASVLDIDDEEIYATIYESLLKRVDFNLIVSKGVEAKVIKLFVKSLKDEVHKKHREVLLARTVRNFENLFPIARTMKRKLTLHIGPTNSGKTYKAMQKLKDADTGCFLAPLRLLALEGYEELKEKGVASSLITGEEEIVDEDATHISSTIEMLNFEIDVDVCVIDEVQMIDDRDRGWAWANAIIGVPAHEVIMTGSPNSKDAIIALAEYLGEELEIIEFERKNSLHLNEKITKENEVEDATAIIAFSRKDVLQLKKRFSPNFRVSVVYGNLSPEVRREEARRFRDGETQILVATDAIAMGLNLPIKNILFYKADKFDGESRRELKASEIAQISGRAGRYGMHEEGFVGALDDDVLEIVESRFNAEIESIQLPLKVMANIEHIKLVSNILEEESLEDILKFFVKYMEFNGPFDAVSLDNMLRASKIVDKYNLDLEMKYKLASAPLSLNSPYLVREYQRYIVLLEKKEQVPYKMPKLRDSIASSLSELLHIEDMVKEISLYLWLSYRFDEQFIDVDKAKQARGILNTYIENSLQVNL